MGSIHLASGGTELPDEIAAVAREPDQAGAGPGSGPGPIIEICRLLYVTRETPVRWLGAWFI